MSEKLNLIKKLSFFNSLNEDQLSTIDAISKVSNYAKNSVLYYENDRNNKIFFLISGLIKVYKIDKYENEIFLYYIYKNSMISELTTVSSDTIHCFSNAEFMEESVVLEVDFLKFKQEFLSKNIDYVLEDISTALREQYSFTEDTIFELLALSKEIKKRIQTEIDFEEVFYVEDFVQDMEFVEHAMKQECIRDVSFALLHRLHAENSNFSSYIKHYYETDSVNYLQDVFREDLAFIEQLIKERKASFFIPQLLRNFNTKRNAENATIKMKPNKSG